MTSTSPTPGIDPNTLPDYAPIGGNLRRAVDEIAAANGVSNRVTHLVYSHHHDDHIRRRRT
jgi:glyoxylase-like metal-dependent hydrolase (beta-lactamase superfamily II)